MPAGFDLMAFKVDASNKYFFWAMLASKETEFGHIDQTLNRHLKFV